MYRIWTKDVGEKYSVLTNWQSYSKCKQYIIGRWKHWPSFAYISKAKSLESFLRYN